MKLLKKNSNCKRQFNLYLTVANEPYFIKGNARELDLFLSFMRENSLSWKDINQIIKMKSEVQVYYKIKNALKDVDSFLGSEFRV